jgi:hypothetical protein
LFHIFKNKEIAIMQRDGKAVKAPATRVSRLEARREKLLVTIERTQRRFEKADKMAKRALKTLATLERKRRRMDKAMTKANNREQNDGIARTQNQEAIIAASRESAATVLATASNTARQENAATSSAESGIPEFLDRSKKLNALPDPRTKEKRAERRAVEREKREADLRGKTRKMPLTGKAALDAIKNGN